MPRGRTWQPIAALAAIALLSSTLPSPASAASVPARFFGVVPQGWIRPAEYDRMEGVVGTLRLPIYWAQCEPHPGDYDFASVDEVVGSAAERGVRVFPFVYGSPPWLTRDPALPPLRSARGRMAWAAFLRALVRRYGPRGAFWERSARPEPVHRWQIWNEPNFVLFWHPRPSPRGYARLLRIAAHAIRREDRDALIVTAGVAPVGAGLLPWRFLRRMYRVAGVRRDFDEVAVHPYASSVAKMDYQIEKARRVMSRAGDATTPLQVTELGVASGGPPSTFNRSPLGQAAFLRRAFGRLLRERARWHIAGVDWFSWQDASQPDLHCVFCEFAGLFDISGQPKPAWWAFRRAATRAEHQVVR